MLAECFDECRFARAGRAGNADADGVARKGKRCRQQRFGAFTVACPGGFNQCYRAGQRLAIARAKGFAKRSNAGRACAHNSRVETAAQSLSNAADLVETTMTG